MAPFRWGGDRQAGDLQHFMDSANSAIELFHGYTYSRHPVASAAGLTTLKLHQHLSTGRVV